MSEHDEQQSSSTDEPERAESSPGPGYPAGAVEPSDTAEAAGDPTNATGAPPISGEEQHEGQTTSAAPDDEVGVPDDVGD
jgi:hypothetical protein